MKMTQELTSEHQAVLVALELLRKVGDALAARDEHAPEHLDQLLGFFRGFVDRCHHAKEEDVLFPEMELHGLERGGGPVGAMLEEHEAGRRHVRAIADGLARFRQGDGGALREIQQNARAYQVLLQDHIEREENVLFPMAEEMIPPTAAVDVASRFAAIERERVGPGTHDEDHALLDRLRGIYGV